ncbi:hypothetical protein BKA81DRAFT_366479 [Phyllosticta paracitricarpa]
MPAPAAGVTHCRANGHSQAVPAAHDVERRQVLRRVDIHGRAAVGARRRRGTARLAAPRARAAARPPRGLFGLPHGQLAGAVLPQGFDGSDSVGRQRLRRRHSERAHRGLRRRRRQDGLGAAAARRARAPRLVCDRVGRHWAVLGAAEEGRELACPDELRSRMQPPRPPTQLL